MITSINEFKKIFESTVKKSDKIDIYRDNDYIVVRPLTHKAACKYGSYSSWCISTPSDSSTWDSSPTAIVIFIIQRNYKITKDHQQLINELIELNDLIQSGEASDEDEEKYNNLLFDYDALDLSKIAIIANTNNNKITIWDNNNIEITDVYEYKDLPISDNVIDAIENYLNSI